MKVLYSLEFSNNGGYELKFMHQEPVSRGILHVDESGWTVLSAYSPAVDIYDMDIFIMGTSGSREVFIRSSNKLVGNSITNALRGYNERL